MVSGFFQHFFLKYFNRFGFSFRFPIYVFFFRWIPVLSTYYFKHIWLKTNETKEPGWIYSVATTTSNKYRYRIYFRNNDSPHVDERNKKKRNNSIYIETKNFPFFSLLFSLSCQSRWTQSPYILVSLVRFEGIGPHNAIIYHLKWDESRAKKEIETET